MLIDEMLHRGIAPAAEYPVHLRGLVDATGRVIDTGYDQLVPERYVIGDFLSAFDGGEIDWVTPLVNERLLPVAMPFPQTWCEWKHGTHRLGVLVDDDRTGRVNGHLYYESGPSVHLMGIFEYRYTEGGLMADGSIRACDTPPNWAPSKPMMSTVVAMVGSLAGFLNLHNPPVTTVRIDAKVQRGRERRGLKPLPDYRILHMRPPRSRGGIAMVGSGEGPGKRLHRVSWHPRRLPDGRYTVVRDHWRGNPLLGVVKGHRVVKAS